jgi:transglutaminase/protease-like cytokinesis protein 3
MFSFELVLNSTEVETDKPITMWFDFKYNTYDEENETFIESPDGRITRKQIQLLIPDCRGTPTINDLNYNFAKRVTGSSTI